MSIEQTKSRTEYSARNVSLAMMSRLLTMVLGYVSRIILTRTLAEAYVGVNGLFNDVLSILAISELGFGTAIIYALYKPIAEGNTEKIKSLMAYYRKVYFVVATIMTTLGLSFVPFLKYIIKDKPDIPNLTGIYLLYLLNSVVSFFFVYRRDLIEACQQKYITSLIQSAVWLFQICIQIVVLYTTHNFVLYLVVMLAGTLSINVITAIKAERMFPFVKDREVVPLSDNEKKDISHSVKSLLVHKLGDVAVSNTDNILISTLVGIEATAVYSNYLMIIESVRILMAQFFASLAGSVGNLVSTADKNRVKKIYEAIFFISQWILGIAGICLFEALDIFVKLSFGNKYVMDRTNSFLLVIVFYVTGSRSTYIIFRDALGLFNEDKVRAVAAAIVNLIVSIALGRVIGLSGIFIGTIASTILTSGWIEPMIIYKRYFKEPLNVFFAKVILYATIAVGVGFANHYICSLIDGSTVIVLFVRVIITFVFTNVVFFLLLHKTWEFIFIEKKIRDLIIPRLRKWRHIE